MLNNTYLRCTNLNNLSNSISEGLSWRRPIRRRVRPHHGPGRDDEAEVEDDGDTFSEVISSSTTSLWTMTSAEEGDEERNSHSRLVTISSPSSSPSSSSRSSSSAYPSSSSPSSLSATTAATTACLVLVLISCCNVQPTGKKGDRLTRESLVANNGTWFSLTQQLPF